MKSPPLTPLLGKYKWVLLVLAALGAIFVYSSTRQYGAGISPDSVGYIGAARNLMSGSGFVSYDGLPLVAQPPLYPALLALVGRISGADPLVFAHIVNAILFGLIVYLGGYLTINHLPSSPAIGFVGTLAVLFSPPLFYVSQWAWSEPLFIALVLLTLICGCSYLATNSVGWLLMLSFSAGLSALTRYIGITLILWGALLVLFVVTVRLKERARHLAAFLLLSAVPLVLWLWRNLSLAGGVVGERSSSPFPLQDNVRWLVHYLVRWYIPSTVTHQVPTAVIVTAAASLCVGLNVKSGWPELRARVARLGPIGLFAVLYGALLVTLSSVIAFSPIGERYLSPLYVPVTVVLLVLVEGMGRGVGATGVRRAVEVGMSAALGIWLIYPVRAEMITARRGSDGRGYASKEWRESPTIRYCVERRLLEGDGTCFSNGPDATYILTGRNVKIIPEKTKYMSSERVNDVEGLRGRWPVEDEAYLVWFGKVKRNYLFSVDELGAIADLRVLAQLQDGTVYSVRRKGGGSSFQDE